MIGDLNDRPHRNAIDGDVLRSELDREFEELFTCEYDHWLSLAPQWQREQPHGRKQLGLPEAVLE